MTADVELLPCPFCGGTDIGETHVTTFSVDSSYDIFGCNTCGANFEDGSAREWNARANVLHHTAAQAAEIEALRAEVERLTERAQHAEDVAAGEHFRAERLAEALEWVFDEYSLGETVEGILEKARPQTPVALLRDQANN